MESETQSAPVRPVNRSAAVQPQKAKNGKKLGIMAGLLVVVVLVAGVSWWFKEPRAFEGKAEVDLPYSFMIILGYPKICLLRAMVNILHFTERCIMILRKRVTIPLEKIN